eukprot:scaffold50386_cov65-Phaeocystis_antarctica.AAC.3
MAFGSSSEIWRTFCESHVEATIFTPDEKIWLAEIGSRKTFQEVPGVRSVWLVCRRLHQRAREVHGTDLAEEGARVGVHRQGKIREGARHDEIQGLVGGEPPHCLENELVRVERRRRAVRGRQGHRLGQVVIDPAEELPRRQVGRHRRHELGLGRGAVGDRHRRRVQGERFNEALGVRHSGPLVRPAG